MTVHTHEFDCACYIGFWNDRFIVWAFCSVDECDAVNVRMVTAEYVEI